MGLEDGGKPLTDSYSRTASSFILLSITNKIPQPQNGGFGFSVNSIGITCLLVFVLIPPVNAFHGLLWGRRSAGTQGHRAKKDKPPFFE